MASPMIEECFVCHRLLQSFQRWTFRKYFGCFRIFEDICRNNDVSSTAGMNLYTCKACFKSLERGQKTVDDL